MSKIPAYYSIQAASKEKARAIQELVRSSGLNPTKIDWRNFLVAVDERGNLVACGQVKQHADGSHELASLSVAPAFSGMGIGSELVSQLIAPHVGDLYLMCPSSLGPFYQRFGFEQITEDEMPKYFRRVSKLPGVLGSLLLQGESLLIMRREPGPK